MCPRSNLALARLVVAGLLFCAILKNGPALAQAFWREQPSTVYKSLPVIENELYGHAYPEQSSGQRISRIEKTLFGGSVFGPLEARMGRIDEAMQLRNAQASKMAREPMIAYLEEKLFQQTFPEKGMPERLRQLETQVFGRAFEHYPLPIRIKKLTYAMPLMAKEIRLTKGDTVIARTDGSQRRISRTGALSSVSQVNLDANQKTDPPEERFIHHSDDYYSGIHRAPDGKVLRWTQLPVRIFVKGSSSEIETARQAARTWQPGFSLALSQSLQQADILVSWDKADWDQNPSTLLTRPVVRLGENNTIRTVVLVTLYPVRHLPSEQLLHLVAHQLGHAFGLWGHSEDPDDLMYPALKWEVSDFPVRWRWRLERGDQPSGVIQVTQPSQRDISTLLKLYEQSASDLSVYMP